MKHFKLVVVEKKSSKTLMELLVTKLAFLTGQGTEVKQTTHIFLGNPLPVKKMLFQTCRRNEVGSFEELGNQMSRYFYNICTFWFFLSIQNPTG